MQLQYMPAMAGGTSTTIQATLDANETLGSHTGPIVMFVPEDPGNADYQYILEHNLTIQPAPTG